MPKKPLKSYFMAKQKQPHCIFFKIAETAKKAKTHKNFFYRDDASKKFLAFLSKKWSFWPSRTYTDSF